jgi:hypothetical protein
VRKRVLRSSAASVTLNARPNLSAMPFRQRLALALAVLFARDGVALPMMTGPLNREDRRAMRRAAG